MNLVNLQPLPCLFQLGDPLESESFLSKFSIPGHRVREPEVWENAQENPKFREKTEHFPSMFTGLSFLSLSPPLCPREELALGTPSERPSVMATTGVLHFLGAL